jgi:hypothetical protein
MVKLIRLSTDNSNAHIKANFDVDITIEPNSKIALKNLTFEPSFGSFIANANNSRISFLGDGNIPSDFKEQFITPGIYTNTLELLKEVSQALNRTITLQDGKSNGIGHREIYGEFRLTTNRDYKTRLEFRQSVAMNINSNAYSNADYLIRDPFPPGNTLSWTQPAAPLNQFELDDDQELYLKASAVETHDERYSFIPRFGLGLSKGCAVWYCRIKSSIVNGATPNGFSIGVSCGDPRMPEDTDIPAVGISATERNYEITFIDKNSNYFFRRSHKGVASVNTDSGFAPNDVDSVNIGQHDVLLFKIDNNPNNKKIISAHIYDYNGGPGRERLIFSQPLNDDELEGTLTPYIYMRGNKNNIQLDMLRFTPDPYFLVNNQNIILNNNGHVNDDVAGYVLSDPTFTFDNSETITNPIHQNIREKIALNYIDKEGNHIDENDPVQLSLGGELAEAIGINKKGNTSEFYASVDLQDFGYSHNINVFDEDLNSIGFTIDSPHFSVFNQADSFIVETLSLPLVSYNSSVTKDQFLDNALKRAFSINVNNNRQTTGSRRNILATIPKSSGNGLVQYEPNELIYIDISNNDKLNIRNIELRILNSDFESIKTFGIIDMTLLIDN